MRPEELQEVYISKFGRHVPGGNSEYARRKIAWQTQAETEGGLPESARQHALVIAQSAKLRARVSANLDRRGRGLWPDRTMLTRIVADQDCRLPMPGSVIVKSYRDRRIVVRVLGSGFEYDGRRFDSLSAIAREITGTRWNGFLFFGLTKGGPSGR